MIFRLVVALFLIVLALLPWSWFPPFPWLHEHAQWSDVVFAMAALAWGIEKWRTRSWPGWRPFHVAIVLYLGAAFCSWLFASPDKQLGAFKLLGMAELGMLAVMTADLAARPEVGAAMARVIAWTALVTAAAALVGLALFYGGIHTQLVGTYGDLQPSPWYARMQAGTIQPNMLASFSIFAAAVVARREAALPVWLRRVTQAALGLTVLLTLSRGILAFALAAALRQARTRSQQMFVGIAVAASLVLVSSLTVWNLSLDPARPTEARWETDQPSSRREAFVTSWQTLMSHPLWGSGVGRAPGLRNGRPFDAHCTPLNIAATLGLPALLAFVAIVWFAWRGRERPTDIAVWSGLAGFALDALAQDVEDFRHLWVLLGLAGSGAAPQANTSHSLNSNTESPQA
jgi:hypothetical protein